MIVVSFYRIAAQIRHDHERSRVERPPRTAAVRGCPEEAESDDHRVLPRGLSAGSRVPHGGSYATWSGKACKTAAVRLVTCSLQIDGVN